MSADHLTRADVITSLVAWADRQLSVVAAAAHAHHDADVEIAADQLRVTLAAIGYLMEGLEGCP